MLKLERLRLKNFKGIKSFELDTNGSNVSIFGDNATGKTTIFDAFMWLLFDKDSQNRSNFGIKTLDSQGKVKHGLEHIVEATLIADGKKQVLKKIYSEKWTKPRGSAEKIFSGHTTDYYINDVPVKKNEYDAAIKELADESIFRLLTDPRYFNDVLHWQDRRQILIEVCGDISTDDVIQSSKKLDKLSDILGERSVEDHRKVLAARRKKLNEQLEKIPVRIDEVSAGISEEDEDIDYKAIETKIAELRSEQEEHRQAISRMQSGGEVADKKKQLAEIEAEITKLKKAAAAKIQEKLADANTEKRLIEREISTLQKQIESAETARQALREEWHKVNGEEFEFSQESICPTCGQAIPEYQLEEAREKALNDFNVKKAQRLEAINGQGKGLANEIKELKEKLSSLEEELAKWEERSKSLTDEHATAIQHIENADSEFPPLSEDPEYTKLMETKRDIDSKILDLSEDSKDQIAFEQHQIGELEKQIQDLQSKLTRKSQIEKARARIEELKKEERLLAKEFEEAEEELFLTEEFIRTKVQLLEDKINSQFKAARFKLFNVQVNGGLVECCETLYKGVPYSDLNNAARINVGLDIINTLSKHYKFSAPIWIDNAESITKLTPVEAQVIRLVVSDPDKKLRLVRDVEQTNLFEEAV